ncbi:MAG: hypothetical protein RL769_21, partial [Pseudomonadota bacterium]
MPKFSNNNNFLPSFLFEEEIAKSNHVSGQAIVDPRKAVKGDGNAFSSLSSPNNQPKKKSLYFDYNSFLLF